LRERAHPGRNEGIVARQLNRVTVVKTGAGNPIEEVGDIVTYWRFLSHRA
jgi:hypothetical protein